VVFFVFLFNSDGLRKIGFLNKVLEWTRGTANAERC